MKRWRTRRVVGVAIAAVMLGGLAGWWISHRGPDSSDASHPFHFTIPALSHDTRAGGFDNELGAQSSPALSPDGKHLVYGWQDKLWLRRWERENLKSWKAPSRANGHFGQRIAIQLASSPTNRTAASGALPFPAVRRKESALSPTLCGLERGRKTGRYSTNSGAIQTSRVCMFCGQVSRRRSGCPASDTTARRNRFFARRHSCPIAATSSLHRARRGTYAL